MIVAIGLSLILYIQKLKNGLHLHYCKMQAVCQLLPQAHMQSCALFKIVFKILGYSLVQVHTFVPHHVVPFARIYKEVGLCAGLFAGIEELQCVLWNHGRVVHADYYLQFAL